MTNKIIKKANFKMADCISKISIGSIEANSMKLVDLVVSAIAEGTTFFRKPNPAVAVQGKYYPKEHTGLAWNYAPKSKAKKA